MGPRASVLALACWLLSSAGSAQSTLPSGALAQAPLPSGPLAQTGSGSAALSGPTLQRVIPPLRADIFQSRPRTYAPRFHRQVRPDPRFFPFGLGYVPVTPSALPPRAFAEIEPDGYLQLDVTPRTAEVRIDGLYAGTADDFRRLVPGRSLEAGPHRIELRAPGYESITVDVRLFPNETTTYRVDLARIDASDERSPVAARAAPKTFYVIPGCYAGDKPPRPVRLPPRCDARRVRALPPVIHAVAGPGQTPTRAPVRSR